jgi:hypothetical protein
MTKQTTGCYCEHGPSRDRSGDYDFEDGTGFECQACSANVFYVEVTV